MNGAFAQPKDNPFFGFRMRLDYVEKTSPPNADVQSLLDACNRSRYEGKRNFALLHVLAGSGLRIAEACALRWSDVLWSTRLLRVHGKGGRVEHSPFDHSTASALKMWRAAQKPDHDDAYVFTIKDGRPLTSTWGTHLCHSLSRKAGLRNIIGPHALRRYFATSLLTSTGDIELVKRAGRWRSYSMVEKYAKVSGVHVTTKFVAHGPMDRLRAGRR